MSRTPLVELSACASALGAFVVVGAVGLFARMPALVIIERSAMALFLFAIIGALVGYVARRVLAEGKAKNPSGTKSYQKGEGKDEDLTPQAE